MGTQCFSRNEDRRRDFLLGPRASCPQAARMAALPVHEARLPGPLAAELCKGMGEQLPWRNLLMYERSQLVDAPEARRRGEVSPAQRRTHVI